MLSYNYTYNTGNGQGNNNPPPPPPGPAPKYCDWCYRSFTTVNELVLVVLPSPLGSKNICQQCWTRAHEYIVNAVSPFESQEAEDKAVRQLLKFAARYVQVCLEGGDWDIIDSTPEVSADTLQRIRIILNLKEDHDFTKRQ